MVKFKSPLQKAVVAWLAAHPDTSQRKLAEFAKIDAGDISRIVSGDKATLQMESAARLATAMGTTVEGLLAGRSDDAQVANVQQIDIGLIDPSPHNPRKDFGKEALADLAASIREFGLLEPILVRRSLTKGRFELIAGERRLRAMKMIEAGTVLAIVRVESNASTRAIQIIENLQRVDISPLEEARAFAELQAENKTHWTAAAIGRAIGKSDRFVAQRLSLVTSLVPAAQKLLAEDGMSVETARAFAAWPAKRQTEALKVSWVTQASAQEVRDFMMRGAIPFGRAAFDPKLYDGEILEEGNKKWFMEPDKFKKLQTAAIEAKLKALKDEFPSARQIEGHKVYDWVWADTGEGISNGGNRKVDLKKAKIPSDKFTAVLWVDYNETVHIARNVVPRKAFEAFREKTRKPTAAELKHQAEADAIATAEEKVNELLRSEVARRPAIVARLSVHDQLSGYHQITDDVLTAIGFGKGREILQPVLCPSGKGKWKAYQVPYDGGAKDGDEDDQLWIALMQLDDDVVQVLHGRLIASRHAHVWNGDCTWVAAKVAEICGITLPDHVDDPTAPVGDEPPAGTDVSREIEGEDAHA